VYIIFSNIQKFVKQPRICKFSVLVVFNADTVFVCIACVFAGHM
jgi:hypothetical protein